MIQAVARALDEDGVALGIHVRPKIEEHLARVVHVHVLVHRHDHLREHHLSGPPQPVHQFEGLVGVLFLQAHERQVVKDTLRRQGQVHQLRKVHLQHRHQDPHAGRPQPKILHRGLAHHRRGIDRVLPVGDRRDPEPRILVHRRVKTGVIPERPLVHRIARRIHRSLDHKIRVRRHPDRLAHRRHKRHRFFPHKSRKHVLIDPVGQRGGRRKRVGRIPAQGHRHRHRFSHLPILFPVPRPHLVQLPMEGRLPRSHHLHPVHPHVPLPGFRIFRDHLGQRQKRSPVLRPRLQHGNLA